MPPAPASSYLPLLQFRTSNPSKKAITLHSDSCVDGCRSGKSRGRLVVGLNAKPKDYEPNSGPPLPRPRLLPEHDSTAYILERIFLPPSESARDGKPRPKRMTYIVGWRDLPAARLLVPALKILQYVSPRELETWETALEEELKAERAKLEEEERIIRTETGHKSDDGKKKKRKRGRPPAHAKIESAAVAEPETDNDIGEGKSRLLGGALSLSTPRKRRWKDFEGLSEDNQDGDQEEEESPSRQLEMELYNSRAPEMGPGSYVDRQPEGFHVMVGDSEQDDADVLDDNDGLPESMAIPPQLGSATTPLAYPQNLHMQQSRQSATDTPRNKKKRKKSTTPDQLAQQPQEANREDLWVVKQIEDDELYEVDGVGLVRYFKVRWEGDWPPDQNPSWEPEGNLPKPLIRNYLKASKKRREKLKKFDDRLQSSRSPAPTAAAAAATAEYNHEVPRKKMKQTMLPWAASVTLSKDSSMTEAFVGEEEWESTATPEIPGQ